MRRLVWITLCLVACGDESHRVPYQGTPGQAVTLDLSGWVPHIEAHVGSKSVIALLDTGAPITVVTPAVAGTTGQTRLPLQAFGLTFPDLQVLAASLFATDDVCERLEPTALVGGNLLREFQLGLDYRGKRGFLLDGGEPPAATETIASTTVVPVEVMGGGVVQLQGSTDTIPVGTTRVVLSKANVEGIDHTAVVDTGASFVVVRGKLYDSLGDAARPRLCCTAVGTLYGTVKAAIGRLKQLSLGGATVKNLPVLIWDDSAPFDAISREIGQEVNLLVGGSFLRHFDLYLDYEGQTLELGRYAQQDHVDPDEFVGPGFTLCKAAKAGEGMVVVDVFDQSSAKSAGIRSGDRLIMVQGQSVVGMTAEQAQDLLRGALGSSVDLIFAGAVKKTVQVERLLPDYL